MESFVRTVLFLIFIGSVHPTLAQTDVINSSDKPVIYDAAKAQLYGADAMGMKKYVMAFLKKGPNRNRSQEEAMALQKAHMDNIFRMADEGKLILAGPFFGDGDIRGIYIFDVRTIAEAEELTNSDPAIKAGQLSMELHEWYGSAALMEVNKIHRTISKSQP